MYSYIHVHTFNIYLYCDRTNLSSNFCWYSWMISLFNIVSYSNITTGICHVCLALWVNCCFRVWKVGGLILGWVKSKTEKLTPVASLVTIYLKDIEQGWLVCVSIKWLCRVLCLSVSWYFCVGYYVYLWHGTSV